MNIDIGAKRPVRGDHVFLVGRPRWSSEPSFVTLHDPVTERLSKRNLRGTDPADVVQQLGGAGQFVSITTQSWGTVWFRHASIRRIVEMSPGDLALSSDSIGACVLFTHDGEEDDEEDGPGNYFSLYGVSLAEASEALRFHPSSDQVP